MEEKIVAHCVWIINPYIKLRCKRIKKLEMETKQKNVIFRLFSKRSKVRGFLCVDLEPPGGFEPPTNGFLGHLTSPSLHRAELWRHISLTNLFFLNFYFFWSSFIKTITILRAFIKNKKIKNVGECGS